MNPSRLLSPDLLAASRFPRYSEVVILDGMTLEEFLTSLEQDSPPDSISDVLKSLWHDKKGDWDQAHTIVQEIPSTDGSWVHAYLHREEGDLWNARYWYSRAGRPESKLDLETEWDEIVSTLISR